MTELRDPLTFLVALRGGHSFVFTVSGWDTDPAEPLTDEQALDLGRDRIGGAPGAFAESGSAMAGGAVAVLAGDGAGRTVATRRIPGAVGGLSVHAGRGGSALPRGDGGRARGDAVAS